LVQSAREDEALKGQWSGHRSSRLGLQWRVIYQVQDDRLLVKVFEVTVHADGDDQSIQWLTEAARVSPPAAWRLRGLD